ncbi:ABC transporter permease [Flavobacterium johnsoniae]|uniref:ABC-2 type transporter, permease component n=1 Tax=Flavobacterium johnsoniae (strain ATCC 17061 / DSM 2064 / JCM 8514 / BCRC 14874 / CCUG 350202 / NBRC 14942 / NCIMB 11054 / UW101) TaxID=376686 RepID=A5FKY9_FLAJ1|nr:ABC transporter permease [Flavobacterium johnsoniae]ABQ04128.1 ABC-2 type transporter, permease component [Flavobacterium johnsoniae UW101]OXG02640.1 ABC transporter [Flavobacterium johnsoniae UW101]WQG79002.1 ABC transporter permease [Flavobacterium johnsoniae UW101]SHK13172.1 ABC-2 type transport system permease protein [Flavobacterium johnsoniae]
MLYKIWMSIVKEFLLLKRDLGGLIILFIMPLVLVITVTLIQDSTFKTVSDSKIPILLVDNDKGSVSKTVFENLEKSNLFSVVTRIDNKTISEDVARENVFKGKFQLAIIIPEKLSSDLQAKVDQNVEKIVSNLGFADSTAASEPQRIIKEKEVKLYFDPAVQMSFKNAVMSSIDKMISQIETKSIYTTFEKQLGEGSTNFEQKSFISFKEIIPKINNKEIRPNSVQHNVPAWTLFAIFFIVIPLSINIVKEKSQGTFVRLRTNPVSNLVVIIGKTITYSVICMIQFYMMVAVAVFLFPSIGLPSLNIEGHLALMSVVALFSGFAAIGFGILLGTIASTQEQSAPFGATSVIILAAIGGIWVPVFAMPKIMQIIAKSSPMNWGLDAFYDVLLRNVSFLEIIPKISLLFLFFILTTAIALFYDKKKRAV